MIPPEKSDVTPRSRRTWKLLYRSCPAIVLMGILLLPSLAQPMLQHKTFLRYKAEVAQALEDGRYETAELFAEKMIQLAPPHDVEARFHFATVEAIRGNVHSTRIIMQQLAPADSAGYAPAHLWQARDLLQTLEKPDDIQSQVIRHHLQIALDDLPDQREPRFLLVSLNQKLGDYGAAIVSLEKIIDDDPSLHFLLAGMYREVQDRQKAALHYEAAAHYFRMALASDPRLIDPRINLGECYVRLLRFEEAEQNFNKGINLYRQSSDQQSRMRLAQSFSAMCIAEYQRRVSGNAKGPRHMMSLDVDFLGKALEYDAGNETAIKTLMAFASLSASESREIKEMTLNLLAKGAEQPVLDLILGVLNLQLDETDAASLHFRNARSRDQGIVMVLDNLAWGFMNASPPQWPQALDYSTIAVELTTPDSSIYPHLAGTRGQLYAKLEQWESAYRDLSIAMQVAGDPTETHQLLATVCRKLGREAEAEEHERLATAK